MANIISFTTDSIRLWVNHSGSVSSPGAATQSMFTVSSSLAILAPSRGNSGTNFTGTTVTETGTWNAFILTVAGTGISPSETYNLSFNTSSANYITKVIPTDSQSTKSGNTASSVYVYK